MSSTFDKELVIDIINNILWALDQINKRLENIETAEDFLIDDDGQTKLDSICMQLINIGEALKQIDKITNKTLFDYYPEIEWKKAMAMRDIITHHYFDVDVETVHSVCQKHLPELKEKVKLIKNDLLKLP